MKKMTPMTLRVSVSNLNWYVFGLALLTVGMSLITWHPVWIVTAGVSLYLYGASSILNLSVRTALRAAAKADQEEDGRA